MDRRLGHPQLERQVAQPPFIRQQGARVGRGARTRAGPTSSREELAHHGSIVGLSTLRRVEALLVQRRGDLAGGPAGVVQLIHAADQRGEVAELLEAGGPAGGVGDGSRSRRTIGSRRRPTRSRLAPRPPRVRRDDARPRGGPRPRSSSPARARGGPRRATSTMSRSAAVNSPGWSPLKRSNCSSTSRASDNACSHRRSSSRPTRRFSGSIAWYWRAARSASYRARSSRWCQCLVEPLAARAAGRRRPPGSTPARPAPGRSAPAARPRRPTPRPPGSGRPARRTRSRPRWQE